MTEQKGRSPIEIAEDAHIQMWQSVAVSYKTLQIFEQTDQPDEHIERMRESYNIALAQAHRATAIFVKMQLDKEE